MTRINLLPWRDVRRVQRQRDLVGLLVAAALLALGIVYLAHTEIASRIEFQQQRNEYLRGEIARLKKASEELANCKRPGAG
jgi:type IV pilus assembly protein PilN